MLGALWDPPRDDDVMVIIEIPDGGGRRDQSTVTYILTSVLFPDDDNTPVLWETFTKGSVLIIQVTSNTPVENMSIHLGGLNVEYGGRTSVLLPRL
jgi:hypothetical protein